MTAPGTEVAQTDRKAKDWLRTGDRALIGIMVSDFFVSIAGTIVYLTMVWWVLAEGASELGVTLLVLSIFVPLNAGVIVSGVAVAKYGARRLLLMSKALALVGAILCYVLLVTDTMTLWSLALIAIFVYGSMGPSTSADVARAPALTRLAKRRLAGFHAANGIVVVLGNVIGLVLGGYLAEGPGSATAIASSALLVALSLTVTFASFPRDRILPIQQASNREHLFALTRSVVHRLDGKQISMGSVLVTVALITVAEGFSEVLLPISLRISELPPTALSNALVISVVGSVIAYVVAQAIHGKVNLESTLALTGVVLSAILIVAIYLGGWNAVVISMVAATTVANATAMLVFTSIQLRMPASLQAQAASLWHSTVLTASASVIFITGVVNAHGFLLLVVIAVLATTISVVCKGRLT